MFRVNLEQWKLTHSNAASNNSTWQDSLQLHLDLVLTTNNSLVIYTCLVIGTVLVTLTRSISFYKYCSNASTTLHNLMFGKIVYAPIRFFNLNPPGRILNRFSKDIGAVDELLPLSLLDTLEVRVLIL